MQKGFEYRKGWLMKKNETDDVTKRIFLYKYLDSNNTKKISALNK